LDVAVTRPVGPIRGRPRSERREFDMQHDHLYAMLYEARRRDLEQYAQQARLAEEARRRPRRSSVGRLSRLRELMLASKGRINVGVEEPA
jgi:hypothetical protein